MTLGAVDYAASHFKYKTPSPIHGAPTNKPLKRLKAELRENASSVEANLGGGYYGYLGLVLTDAEYTGMGTHPPRFDASNYQFHCTFRLVQLRFMPSPSGFCTTSRSKNTASANTWKGHFSGSSKMPLRTNT